MGEKLFKSFSQELITSLEIKASREYYYFFEDQKMMVSEKKIDPLSKPHLFKICDETRKWNDVKNKQSLFFDLTLSVSNIFHIFHGIESCCYQNTVLGIMLEWKPKNSKIRRCIKIGEITDYLEKDTVTFISKKIEIKYPNENIDFYWSFYIKQSGSGKIGDHQRFGNTKGLILGRGLLWSIVNEGNGSIFPIEEAQKKDSPLWSIRCNFNNWLEDEFSLDNLAIVVNKTHPMYPAIKFGEETYNDLIFKETIGFAFYTLVSTILETAKTFGQIDDLKNESEKGEKGSILQAIKYFRDTLGIKITAPVNEFVESIKMFFDKEKGLK